MAPSNVECKALDSNSIQVIITLSLGRQHSTAGSMHDLKFLDLNLGTYNIFVLLERCRYDSEMDREVLNYLYVSYGYDTSIPF